MLPGSTPPAAGSGMFVPAQTVGTVLCCICGVAMQPNPANMCARCLRARVDITEGVPRHAAVVYCPDCTSYLQPPRSWLRAGPESPELMQILLRRLNRPLARLRVSLSGAEFVFSEPHSKRLRLKLRLRREVLHGVVLEQTHPVEFTVHDRLCDACARAQANPDQWVAVVQLRQRVPHRRTFLYLEQLLLKHGQAALALRVASAPSGLDFFFGSRSHAARLVDFLTTAAPVHTNTAKQLVSHDPKSSVYNYKHTFSVEICPICREDLIALSPQASRDLGGLGPLVLCVKVTNAIALLDPLTLRVHHLEERKYRVYNFKAALTSKQLVEYIVLDIEHESPEITIDGSRYQLAYAQVARVSDFGKNDTIFTVRTHLGHLLNPGDLALGYDLYGANLNDDDMDTAMMRHNLPEVILVKKSYEKRPRTRRWKLKRLPVEEDAANKARGEEEKRAGEYEDFLKDLEHNAEIRFNINLYKDEDYRSDMASTVGDDVPTVPIEELIEDLSLGDDEEDEGEEGNARAGLAQNHPTRGWAHKADCQNRWCTADELPDDFGFDPLGLGEEPSNLKWYVQAELVRYRFAMARVAGILVTDLIRVSGIPNLPVWFESGVTKFDFSNTKALFFVQLLLMGFAKTKRYMDIINPGSQAEGTFQGIEAALEGLQPGSLGVHYLIH